MTNFFSSERAAPDGYHCETKFFPPPEDLSRYVSMFFMTRFETNRREYERDALLLEWSSMRFIEPVGVHAWIGDESSVKDVNFFACGPTTKPINFDIATSWTWGIGMTPLGWAAYIGASAEDYANKVMDANRHDLFKRYRALRSRIFRHEGDYEENLAATLDYLRNVELCPVPDEERILDIYTAIMDPSLATVSELIDRVEGSYSTVERTCRRVFGFTPKLLLRRQRFVRSISEFIINPNRSWSEMFDLQYHDQAQFIKEFKFFLGMTPREYAMRERPVLDATMRSRAQTVGGPAQIMGRRLVGEDEVS